MTRAVAAVRSIPSSTSVVGGRQGRAGTFSTRCETSIVPRRATTRRRREGWDGVTARLRAGGIDVLVTWEASRGPQRDLEQYAALRRLCEETGTRWAYSGTVYDLAERSDRFRTGLRTHSSPRTKLAGSANVWAEGIAAAAASGRPHGRLLYGYRRVYDESNGPCGSGARRHAVGGGRRDHAALPGGRIDQRTCSRPHEPGAYRAQDDHADGDRRAMWRRSQLHRMLSNPAYAGLRVHQGEIVGKGEWPPIVDLDDWRRVQARLAEPERRAPRRTAAGPVNLLTWIARCGVCGAGLVGGQGIVADASTSRRAAGFHVARDMNHLDHYVTAIVLERLARAGCSLDDSPSEDVLTARREADEMRLRLKGAADEYVAGRLSAATLSRVEAQLAAAIADAERRARYAGLPTTVADSSTAMLRGTTSPLTSVAKSSAGCDSASRSLSRVHEGRGVSTHHRSQSNSGTEPDWHIANTVKPFTRKIRAEPRVRRGESAFLHMSPSLQWSTTELITRPRSRQAVL